jgi:tetratricopeptide (TPR) repeat protein
MMTRVVNARIPLFLAALLLMGAYLSACSSSEKESEITSFGPTYAAWSPLAEYVGIDACQQCHEPQYDSFIRSQMGRSFKHAARSLSDAPWDDVTPLYSEFDDMYYQPYAVGEDLFVKEYRLAESDTIYTRVEQIDFIVGSGQHTNSHIYSENGYLYQIPVTWYTQDQKWGLAPKFEKSGNNYRFSRVITDECMACHNAQPTFVEGSENRFEHVPEGINCEKCHGPGSIHIEEKTAGIIVNTVSEIDFSIVNPGKLSPERELDVCKRCHMQGAAVFEGGDGPLDWRPGKSLAAHENVFWPRQPDSTTHFIMASHPDRLAQSACFLESWKSDNDMQPITCLTCHDPHKPIEETLDTFDATCQNCHDGRAETASALMCTEPTVVAGTNALPCASCHMPESSSTDIPNIRITDHFIRVPGRLSPEEAEDQTRFIRMAALVDDAPSLRQQADGFLTYYEQFTDRPGMLDSAAVLIGRIDDGAEDGDALTRSRIRLWHLQSDHAAIRRLSQSSGFEAPTDAWTFYRIGEAFAAGGDANRSIRWYEQAFAQGRDHLRFGDKLGVAYTQAGRAPEAIAIYDGLLGGNPKFENGLNNRGFAYLLTGDFEAAEEDFRSALALSPDLELSLANLASLLINTDRDDEARPIMRKLITSYPENGEYERVWRVLSSR